MGRILPPALAAALTVSATAPPRHGPPAFPPRLEVYLSERVKLTGAQRTTLMAGAPVTKLLDADQGSEVGVFGAVWINAPIRRYVEAITDIERFERGAGFKVTRRISSPPTLEDFADMRLRDEDVRDLRKCRIGDCDVKLDAATIRALRTEVDWKAPGVSDAVNGVLRRFALQYVNRYLEGGNDRLGVYHDHDRPRSVAEEFRAMIDRMPELTTYMPELRRYLLEHPTPASPGSTSFLYWQETDFGLKPTIRISHLTLIEDAEGVEVASKMLYASHYFWTGVELRTLIPDASRGPGFWFVTVSRSRSDGLSGLIGLIIRGRVRSGVQKGAMAALLATKRLMETPSQDATLPIRRGP